MIYKCGADWSKIPTLPHWPVILYVCDLFTAADRTLSVATVPITAADARELS